MARFLISGVWKSNNEITHYAFHTLNQDNTMTRATKVLKADAVIRLNTPGNTASTMLWNYSQSTWHIGEPVNVVNGANEPYLRSKHDNQVRDNLDHLINYNYIMP